MRHPSHQAGLERQRTVVQLNSLLMVSWEADLDDCSERVTGDTSDTVRSYHLRTRLDGNRVGLLVDPGAHDNLVGGRTADRMEQMLGIPAKHVRMKKALQVEGVGKDAQSAATARKMALRLSTDEGASVSGSYAAPVIADSDLPPLFRLLRMLEQERPVLLWVRLAGPCSGSGNRHDASRTAHLCALIQAQTSQGLSAAVEANVRGQVWNMQTIKPTVAGLHVSRHSWCRHEVPRAAAVVRCNTTVQLATSFELDSQTCACSADSKHVDSKQLGADHENPWSEVLSGIVFRAVKSLLSASSSGGTGNPS